MSEYEFHPAAEVFPMHDKDRFAELVADIEVNGLREPITLCEGKILDGRNRYAACRQLGIMFKTREFEGDPWAYAWSLNGARRDLADIQRTLIHMECTEGSAAWQAEREAIKAEANRKRSEAVTGMAYAPKGEKRVTEKVVVTKEQEPSQPKPESERAPARAAVAKAVGTSTATVAKAQWIKNSDPELAKKVMTGEVKPADATRTIKREALTTKLAEVVAREVIAPTGLYDVIVIDPPWPMEKIERDERPNQVVFDYPTMTESELSVLDIPAADDCHVFLWTTHKFLPMAFRLLSAWQMKYVCTFVWHKPGGFQPIGLPQYNCEFALYARNGSPQFLDTKALPTCFNAPRGAHSEKPEEFYEVLRRVTGGRRLDMFNRRVIDGFTGWGKESNQ